MLYSGVIEPAQVAMITRVLDDYCLEHQITIGSIAHETAASMIIALYRHGYQTRNDLKDALDCQWASKH